MFGCLSNLRLPIVVIGCLAATTIHAVENPKFTGAFKQGGLVLGELAEGETVSYQGKILKLNDNRQFLLGFGRNQPPTAEIIVHHKSGDKKIVLNVASRDYAVQKIEGVPQKTVTPSDQDLKRIKQDAALVKQARRLRRDNDDFTAGFTQPAQGVITGVYGSQRFYNGVPKSPHYGIDYAAPTGTAVIAPAAGVVSLVHGDMFYSGGTMILDHGHGLSSTFLHLSEILVETGQQVSAGMLIAKIGASGRATGPHLDWRMNWLDQRIDPQLVLETLPASK
jgi:murein DD-endopeptidase MepM/ murein hydrolase activator NlpD